LASGLEELHGVPVVKSPLPYGMKGTDAWYRALGRIVGKDAEVEAHIAAEKAAIADDLAALRRELAGKTAYVAAGSSHGHSLISVLRELGVKLEGGCFYHHDAKYDHGDRAADHLRHAVDTYGDFKIGICNKQVFESRQPRAADQARHAHRASWKSRRMGRQAWHSDVSAARRTSVAGLPRHHTLRTQDRRLRE
jgi:nitrogenase molybdenum-iron protein alpha/beta subunit